MCENGFLVFSFLYNSVSAQESLKHSLSDLWFGVYQNNGMTSQSSAMISDVRALAETFTDNEYVCDDYPFSSAGSQVYFAEFACSVTILLEFGDNAPNSYTMFENLPGVGTDTSLEWLMAMKYINTSNLVHLVFHLYEGFELAEPFGELA